MLNIKDLSISIGKANERITVYKNCWFTNLAKTFSSQDYIVSETASVQCETVYTQLEDGSSVVGADPMRVINPEEEGGSNNIERTIDSGAQVNSQRGAMAPLGIRYS